MLTGFSPDLDYQQLLNASRKLQRSTEKPKMRLALLSDAATQQFIPVLKAILDKNGYYAEIYEGAFDAIEFEAYDGSSGLYVFEPDSIIILNAVQALHASFAKRTTEGIGFIRETVGKITGVWDAIHARCQAWIVQSTFAMPRERYFGNFDLKVPQSFYATTATINAGIAEAAQQRSGVLLNDVDGVASLLGRRHFFDDRFWDMWKTFCAVDCLPYVAQNLVDVLLALRGRVVKCVVVDLDNTLWGGVIGDDGIDGIQLNAHGEGEAFYRLQVFLKELLRRGILLCVCSKNEEAAALLPFHEHPEMVLKRDDITCFVANWRDKAENIRQIRETLNIGFDSIVFLDDNPFERNLVRKLVPDVVVPELPEDPSEFVSYLAGLNLFETTSFSSEDVERSELYKREAERLVAAENYASVEEFLESLDIRIVFSRFDSFHLPRIAQLMQRSNQFNLTTRRLGESECERMMKDPGVFPFYIKLADRLGDHGLISVIILEPQGQDLVIRDWLMSCRVLARGVEQYAMNEVFSRAADLGLSRVIGEYIPTAKNGMVCNFFQQFAFSQVSDKDGVTRWALSVQDYRPKPVYIKPAIPEIEIMTAETTQ